MTDINELTAKLKPVGEFIFEQLGQRWHHIKHGEASFTEPRLPATKLFKESDFLALTEALEAAERERDNWRNSFDNERFRADKLAKAFKTEHEQLLMANGALITQHMKANGAERRIAELEAKLEAAEKRIAELQSDVEDAEYRREAALKNGDALVQLIAERDSRIAELEARALTVKLPDVLDRAPLYAQNRTLEAVAIACAELGLKLQVEGE
ncbi:hypothetical protein [Enterobacter sp. ENT03]|uniref:hypothetical protein n=1 Tax=Enterobacter sp. ENT03 TaxID=2854780 RepID=UPI001C48BD84|nr:hypothetical protein [Enterobacter sp. ENT03]MBV7404503.1 hypothetical protein [Enterobacter sp. ENT03]